MEQKFRVFLASLRYLLDNAVMDDLTVEELIQSIDNLIYEIHIS